LIIIILSIDELTNKVRQTVMRRFSDSQCKFIKSLYNNEDLSDVKIIVSRLGDSGSSDKPSELKDEIYAHKFLLCISSDLARTMFLGEGAARLKESQTNTLDLSAYDPTLVKMCILSLYDLETASKDLSELIIDDPEVYGVVLDLVTYLGLNRLQLVLESIGVRIFDKIWFNQTCRTYLVNSLVISPGNKKGNLAQLFILKLIECNKYVNSSEGDSNSDPEKLQQYIEFIDFMQNLDIKQLKQITTLGAKAKTRAEHTEAFHLWSHWYAAHKHNDGMKALFDDIISKGAVNFKMVNPQNIIHSVLAIKGTVTYNWVMQQYPDISRVVKDKMTELKARKDNL